MTHLAKSLKESINSIFVQLTDSLNQLSQAQFVQPCKTLSNNTIGQHIRHIIELFQCLEIGYATGVVNYENRKRDASIETIKSLAVSMISGIYANLERPNKELVLEATYHDQSGEMVVIETNYFREIAYNLEHTIHHMAIMRIGMNEVSQISLSAEFGVAASTIKHRKSCAQ